MKATTLRSKQQDKYSAKRKNLWNAEGNKNNNASLPSELQGKMENSFGQDFSSVNIHQNSSSANEINARAYTEGNEIHFAPGAYNTHTTQGQELIAHELTHVAQQHKGSTNIGFEKDQSKQEEEADKNSKLAVSGNNVNVSNGAKNSVQKKDQEVKTTTGKVEHGDSRVENGKTEYWDAEFNNGANKPKGKWVTLDHTNSQIVSDFITKHYGVRPRQLERFWFENKSLRDNLSKQGDPVLNYTIFVMEGGGQAITDNGINYNNVANPMSSYIYFGLDFVASEFPKLVKGNFLPADFAKKYKLKIGGTSNEKNPSGIAFYDYPNFESATKAMNAYVGYSTSNILELSKKLGIEAPTNDEKVFWTYLYFNNPDWANSTKLKEKGGYQLNKWTYDDKKNVEYKSIHDALSINIDTMALMRVVTYKYFKIRFNDKARYK